jgi:hypothetical protein
MWTEVILGKLHGISEAPWADWYGKPLDARQLAKLLKPYGIGSHLIRIGDDVARDTDGSTWRTRGPDTASPRHPTRGRCRDHHHGRRYERYKRYAPGQPSNACNACNA